MNQALSRKLAEVTADTLGKLAFIFAFPTETVPAMDGQGLETVRVDFNGPCCGVMELGLPASTLNEIAVNMLGAGDGEPLTVEQQNDALKELANVVCGNLLPALAGDAAEFSLHAPYIATGVGRPASEPDAVGYLMLEGGACRVWLRLEHGPLADPAVLNAAGGHP